ncbi:hypothetical protein NWI01_33080 [Nitrobacter winogradskyi]|uniref:Uncharacterized protein n=1 Tax=Nitrobacter winogradskyi TaxID=913 RepID=A0A4Y3WJ82_NITWI|nr:hypothetical protein NWI01_33080 [Nitrobacter winogradskyi]
MPERGSRFALQPRAKVSLCIGRPNRIRQETIAEFGDIVEAANAKRTSKRPVCFNVCLSIITKVIGENPDDLTSPYVLYALRNDAICEQVEVRIGIVIKVKNDYAIRFWRERGCPESPILFQKFANVHGA